jgi:hypothetical protein
VFIFRKLNLYEGKFTHIILIHSAFQGAFPSTSARTHHPLDFRTPQFILSLQLCHHYSGLSNKIRLAHTYPPIPNLGTLGEILRHRPLHDGRVWTFQMYFGIST